MSQKKNDGNFIKKRAFILSACLAFLLLLSCIFLFAGRKGTKASCIAEIYQDRMLIQSVDLSKVEKPYEITLSSSDGGYNTLFISPGKIAVKDADCQDRLCVKMGEISLAGIPLVCLPHRLVIVLKSKGGTLPDAATY